MVECIVSEYNEPSCQNTSRLQKKSPGKGGKGQAFNSAPARTVNALLWLLKTCPSFAVAQEADHYFHLRRRSPRLRLRGVRVSLEAQKGLQPADGQSEHNFVKEVAIQEARQLTAISWLDISSAFGTVSH
ncbi:hypothetical protein T12_10933 [Trichinella patagoniensis]|uniref:Retrovirus-related Pol polyprotein from type-1 retrotransposable element n=1 Tax=Trichinella patagoniensis TaxID=990121 RepID=A0A0V0Z5L0_9BILA|nr:hypothetical protein T12_10933 [Trichinella patagoniensis]